LNELLGAPRLVRRTNDLFKFTGVYYAGLLQELKRPPRLTLSAGEAVAKATTRIIESAFSEAKQR
jgi:hypothetical protein